MTDVDANKIWTLCRQTKSAGSKLAIWPPTDKNSYWYQIGVELGVIVGAPPPPPPPPPAGQFGTALPPRIAETTGPEVVCTTRSQLDAALAADRPLIRVKGTIDYGGPATTNGPMLKRRGTAQSTSTLYGIPAEGDRIVGRVHFDGDYWRIRGLDIQGWNCVKIANSSAGTCRYLDIDRCRLHGAAHMAVLSGWGVSSDIQIWDTIIDQRGMTTSVGDTPTEPYGIYPGGPTSRWTIGSCLLLNGNGWSLHFYPTPTDVLYTGCTMVGGIIRGGVLLGSRARNVVGVGCVIVGSPTGAFEVNSGAVAGGCKAYDMVGWQNRDGWWTAGYASMPNDNLLTGDPMLDAQWRPKPGSPVKGHVKQARWPLLPPVDLGGKPRVSADAGCYAA